MTIDPGRRTQDSGLIQNSGLIQDSRLLSDFIRNALNEDIGDGDHSSLACIPDHVIGKAHLLVKDSGILAGVEMAQEIFKSVSPEFKIQTFIPDGTPVKQGDIAFIIEGKVQDILKTERLVLNCMQRMSGIATYTNQLVKLIEGTNCKLLDTRKTTPGIRFMEKWAVKIGGGHNHRFGLFDMIMLKDNHIDYAGGITPAINAVAVYLKEKNKDLKIEVEARSLNEVNEILETGKINRIMLDNFTIPELEEAVKIIDKRYETEASGGITEINISDYAKTGVDYISVGAITHNFRSLDMSLKAL